MAPYRRQLTEAMEHQIGVIYLWNGQEIVSFQPGNCEETTLTKRVGQKKIFTRIVYIKGKQRG